MQPNIEGANIHLRYLAEEYIPFSLQNFLIRAKFPTELAPKISSLIAHEYVFYFYKKGELKFVHFLQQLTHCFFSMILKKFVS